MWDGASALNKLEANKAASVGMSMPKDRTKYAQCRAKGEASRFIDSPQHPSQWRAGLTDASCQCRGTFLACASKRSKDARAADPFLETDAFVDPAILLSGTSHYAFLLPSIPVVWPTL